MRTNFSLLTVFVCLLNLSGLGQMRGDISGSITKTPVKYSAAAVAAVASENETKLPIRRVILYSNGVAYIERRGVVSGSVEVNLSFKQSQVDDVLKSMVVLDLGEGKIGAVSYNSSAPAGARMSEIPFSVSSTTPDGGGIAGVLSQLQGAKVSVTTAKGIFAGAILTVERKTVTTEKITSVVPFLVIASETGEISSFDLSEIRSVKLLDEGTRKDLNEFASAAASARRRDAKTITVTSAGNGQREMVVSYTIAAPIWKTTYRVVLDEAGKPFFQGWAIVDNISEEDWQNVQLSLVSGTPISFIQPIQQPFYRYRPVVPIPADLKIQPQIYEEGGGGNSGNSISGMVVDPNGAVIPNANVTITNSATGQQFSLRTDSGGNFSQAGLTAGNYTVTVSSPGFSTTNVRDVQLGSNLQYSLQVGSVSATVDVTANQIQNLPANNRNFSQYSIVQGQRSSSSNTFVVTETESGTSVSDALTSGKSGVQTAATGEEIGDLFEYRIAQPITVLRDRSALIPIVQTKMDGERVAVYNEAVRSDRPYSGVLLKNLTNLTLENGSLTVIDGNAYAGEALMERLKPKEQRLISFALDLGTSVRVRNLQDREAARLVKIVNGVFQVHYFTTNEKLYQITNQTERPKVLYLEYPVRDGWTLSERTPKPAYTTQRYHRFRVELKPFEEKQLTIVENQPLMDNYSLTSLTRPQLEVFLTKRYIDAGVKARLEKLIDLRMQITQIEQKLEAFDDEEESISSDQKRLRENIEALSKTAEAKQLIARYIQKADAQESRLEQIEKERKSLEQEKERLEAELTNQIRGFNLERNPNE
jgi:hypothetical protein